MGKYTFSLIACATLVASLEAKELSLDPIVITATKAEQPLKDVTSNNEIITGEELEEKHVITIGDALNLVAGISTLSNGGLGKSTSVYLRGFDSKRTLVLIDGIRYNDISSMDGASFEHLMMNEVERIEVIKGAQSGIWGADASAGVVNIITKTAKTGTTLNAHLGAGSFKSRKYGASVAHKTDRYDIRIGANKIRTEGFTSYAKRDFNINNNEDDGYKNTTLNLNAGYRFDHANTLRLTHTGIDAYTEYDNTSSDSLTAHYNKKESLNQIAFENKNDFASTKLYTNRSTFKRNYSSGTTFDSRTNEYGITSEIPYLSSDFLLIGGDFKSFEHLNQINKKVTDKALFATNSNLFAKHVILTESLRTDRYDAFDDKTTGKVGLKYNITPDLYFSSNYGTAYNIPTLYQLYAPTYGNIGLKPEDTRSYDFSFGYNGLEITYFSNHVKEMIDFDFTTYAYNNISGTSTLKGVEVGYKKRVLDNTLLSLSYTRLSAKNQRGEDLRRRAKENLKFGVDYYGVSKLHLGLYGEYIGTRYDQDNKQGAQTGRYTVANAVANYDLSKNVRLYGKIDNITDRYYQSVANYATSPRAYYGGVEVSF